MTIGPIVVVLILAVFLRQGTPVLKLINMLEASQK